MKRYFSIFNLMLIFGLLVLALPPLCGENQLAYAREKSRGEAVKLPPPK